MNLKTRKKLRKLKKLKRYYKGSLKISVLSTKYLKSGFTVKCYEISKRVSNTSKSKSFLISKEKELPKPFYRLKPSKINFI